MTNYTSESFRARYLFIYTSKQVYSRAAMNCNTVGLWQTTYKSRPEESKVFYREQGGVGKNGCKQKAHWRKLGAGSVVSFHWLSCCQARRKSLFLGLEVVSSVTSYPESELGSSGECSPLWPPESVFSKVSLY